MTQKDESSEPDGRSEGCLEDSVSRDNRRVPSVDVPGHGRLRSFSLTLNALSK
jgi:hypothetical protein